MSAMKDRVAALCEQLAPEEAAFAEWEESSKAIKARRVDPWQEYVVPGSGAKWYVNVDTLERTAAPPPVFAAPPPTSPWRACVDPATGRTYYANVLTGASQWAPPVVAPLAPSNAAVAPLACTPKPRLAPEAVAAWPGSG